MHVPRFCAPQLSCTVLPSADRLLCRPSGEVGASEAHHGAPGCCHGTPLRIWVEPLCCLSAGELGAMEAIMEQLMAKDLLKPLVLKALWLICSASFDQLAAGQVG